MTEHHLDKNGLKSRKGVKLAFQTVGLNGIDKIIQYTVSHPNATLHDFDKVFRLK